MNEIHFASGGYINLLWILPPALLLFVYGFRGKDRALRKFADRSLLDRMGYSANSGRSWTKAAMVLAAMLLLVASLCRPQWGLKPVRIEGNGRDIVFVLDVSKSMLAQDIKPNRLEKAKMIISDFLQSGTQNRVALVVFAGSSAVACPLTLDYGFFRSVLEGVGVESVALGGTRIGDGLRKATEDVFSDRVNRLKDVILFSDGEDQGSHPVSAAGQAGERGIRLIAVGLGDAREGQRIPIAAGEGNHTFLLYRGNEVWTRMNPVLLSTMAQATPGGKFLEGGSKDFNLEAVSVSDLKTSKSGIEFRDVQEFEDRFQLFILSALLLLGMEALAGIKRDRP